MSRKKLSSPLGKWTFPILGLALIFGLPLKVWSQEDKRGIAVEFSAGYPELTIVTPTQTARYNGHSLKGNVIFPVASGLSYSLDLDVSYVLDALENNAGNSTEGEWAHFNGYGTGLRFRLSYFEAGVGYHFLKGKHLRGGSRTEIYDYTFNPVSWKIGFNIPLNTNTSIGVNYSANLKTNVASQGQEFQIQNQTLWIKVQIDFGLSFLNLMSVEESFSATSTSSFF